MVKLTTTILLISFFVLINVDFVYLLHSLCTFPLNPPRDNDTIFNSKIYLDISMLFNLGLITLFSIFCFVHAFMYFSIDVHFVPFDVNLDILKKSDINHAIPYFKQTYFIILFLVIWFICLNQKDLMIYQMLSSHETIVFHIYSMIWNLFETFHLIYTRVKFLSLVLVQHFLKSKQAVVF